MTPAPSQAGGVAEATAGRSRAATEPTRSLARFVSGLRPGDVPSPVRAVLSKAVLDAVGCGLHGLTLPWGTVMRDFAAEQGGPAQATLWRSGGKQVSAANAALSMGTAIHGFELDDHHRAKLHASAAVLPAALALGEHRRVDGATLLAALAAGYETMIRVSLGANPSSSRMRGWHLTGTCGTFGAAAAASVILGLDAETTASALGLAGTQSAGLWAFNADGAMSKRLHPGRAAQSGVMAALLAARGFEGPRYILEAPDGGFLAATSDDPRPEEITAALGSEWRTEKICFKRHSCCGSNHACIDAALLAMEDGRLAADDVAEVVVGVSRVVERQTGFEYAPSTVLNAQMSVRYDVAVAMIDGEAMLDQFTPSRIRDPRVLDLVSRVRVVVDPDMDAVYPRLYAGVVTLVGRDGRKLSRRVDYPKGMPESPMDLADVERKFRSLCCGFLSREAADELVAALGRVFELPDVSGVCRRLGAV